MKQKERLVGYVKYNFKKEIKDKAYLIQLDSDVAWLRHDKDDFEFTVILSTFRRWWRPDTESVRPDTESVRPDTESVRPDTESVRPDTETQAAILAFIDKIKTECNFYEKNHKVARGVIFRKYNNRVAVKITVRRDGIGLQLKRCVWDSLAVDSFGLEGETTYVVRELSEINKKLIQNSFYDVDKILTDRYEERVINTRTKNV